MSRRVSRAEKARQADRLLRALLRTPKTRAGLIAAALSKGVSRNYLYGWLSQQRREGTVAVLKSAGAMTFQMAVCVVQEVPNAGLGFPAWLEPRLLPPTTSRRVFIDGSGLEKK